MDLDNPTVIVHIIYKKSDWMKLVFLSNRINIVFTAVFVFAAMFLVLVASSHFVNEDAPEYMRYFAIGALIVVPLITVVLNLSTMNRTADSLSRSNNPLTLRLDDEGMEASREFSEEKILWNGFKNVWESKKQFIFVGKKGSTLIVPKRCFVNNEEMEVFRALVDSKLDMHRNNKI